MNTAQEQKQHTSPASSTSSVIRQPTPDVLDHSAIERLPEILSNLLVEKNDRQVDIVLDQLTSKLHDDKPQRRSEASEYLTDTLEILIAHREWRRMETLLPAVERMIPIAAKNDTAVWQIITALSIFAAYQIEMGRYAAAHKALTLFNNPEPLASASKTIREQAGQLISDLSTKSLMELLLIEYLYDRDKGDDAGRLLVLFSGRAAAFLVDAQSLQQSKDKPDALLKLFENIGQPAEKSLCELLRRTDDWYLLRNVIKLLGERGNPTCFIAVTALLEHEDLRVKGEVLRAASRIDADEKKEFFLKALQSVPRQLKEPVVALLGDIADSSLVAPLANLLDDASVIHNKAGYQLQITTCKTLGKIGSVKAIPILKKIIADNADVKIDGISTQANLLRAANQAIENINHGGKHKTQRAATPESLNVPERNTPVAARETNIIQIAMAGDQARATTQLFDLIIECVHNKDFHNAERLRERFNEINPNALTEIIQSAELIEQEKNGVLVRGYLDIWSNLLHELTAEEFSAIYHELENRHLEPEEVLVNQGDKNDELFFINHGMIRAFYKKNGRKIYVKSLSDGDLAGENFFGTSVWTISMSAQTESQISILKRSSFTRWQEVFPGLETKLRDFYNRSNDVRDLLKRKGLNRRIFERYNLSRRIEFEIINNLGKSMGQRFKGKLSDISRGGLAMHFHLAQEKHIRVLFGRRLHITVPVAGSPPKLNTYGSVTSIKRVEPKSSEYKLHFVFDAPLEQETLQMVLG
jgi:HEAT repeat protein/CRP-like cAMP-binding protein